MRLVAIRALVVVLSRFKHRIQLLFDFYDFRAYLDRNWVEILELFKLNLGLNLVPGPKTQNGFQIRKAGEILHGAMYHSLARLHLEVSEKIY